MFASFPIAVTTTILLIAATLFNTLPSGVAPVRGPLPVPSPKRITIGLSTLLEYSSKYLTPIIISLSSNASAESLIKKKSLKYFFAGFNLTITNSASGAAPIARLATYVPCPFFSISGDCSCGSSPLSISANIRSISSLKNNSP